MPKCEALRRKNKHYRIIHVARYEFSDRSFMDAKRDPKKDQTWSTKRSDIVFKRILRIVWGVEIYKILAEEKSVPKIQTKSETWGPKVFRSLFWGLPGRVCGSSWGFGACKFVDVHLACFASRVGGLVELGGCVACSWMSWLPGVSGVPDFHVGPCWSHKSGTQETSETRNSF